MNGIINLYKPKGRTSHDMVNYVRRCLGIKKVGHMGTLDPIAEGVLLICVGKATKAAELLIGADKRYTTVLKLGVTTDTQDLDGEIIETKEVRCSNEEIGDAVNSFKGEIYQTPPMYSAIKIRGRRLYSLARKGIEIEREKRKVTIYDINVLKIDGPYVTLDVSCSKGTYIRTLCSDIGKRLGCGAAMSELVRTRSGNFTLDGAVRPEEFEKNPEAYIMPVDKCFLEYPSLVINEEREAHIRNGVNVYFSDAQEGVTYRVYSRKNEFLCLARAQIIDGRQCLKIIKSFY